MQQLDFSWKNLIEKELATKKGFTAIGYAAYSKKRYVDNKVIATFIPGQINEVARKHLQIQPEKNGMFTLTSESPMIYYWSNTFDVNNLLDYYEKNNSEGGGLGGLIDTVEATSQTSLRAIVSYLGEQVSFIAESAAADSYFELPLFLTAWQLHDGVAFQSVIEKLVASYQISIINNRYGPVVYYYWAQAPQDGIFPLYGFWQNYFFFGNSLSLFKKVIDNQTKDMSLVELPEVRTVDPGFSLANNSVTYFDNGELIAVLRKFFNMIGTLVAIEDKEIARKFTILVDEIIDPLLEGAAMYTRTGTRSYFLSDAVVIESRTSLEKY